MTKINLLPWRELEREERKKQFILSLFGSVAASLFFILLWHAYTQGYMNEQIENNAFLKKEIDRYERNLATIEALKGSKNKLLSRMSVIQELQQNRPKIVELFDTLPRIVPQKVTLQKIKRTGDELLIDGIADTSSRVSAFMRKMDKDSIFVNPSLTYIKSIPQDAFQITSFEMTVSLRSTPLIQLPGIKNETK